MLHQQKWLEYGFLLSAYVTFLFLLCIVDLILSLTLVVALLSSSPCSTRYTLPGSSMKISLSSHGFSIFWHNSVFPTQDTFRNPWEVCSANQVCRQAQLCNKPGILWLSSWDQNTWLWIFWQPCTLPNILICSGHVWNQSYLSQEYNSSPFSLRFSWSCSRICGVWKR